MRSFRRILDDTAIPFKRTWRENKSVQEHSLSRMVYVYVDFRKAEENAEMCGTI
jgi:hypothetical protein